MLIRQYKQATLASIRHFEEPTPVGVRSGKKSRAHTPNALAGECSNVLFICRQLMNKKDIKTTNK